MKRKRADRLEWRRVTKKRNGKTYIESSEFTGYVSIICIDTVNEPLWINLWGENVCLADDGYIWLQHFPRNACYAVTTIFNAQGELIRWYIDICRRHFCDEQGILWYEDLYLDLDISPSGAIGVLDADELDEALQQGLVSSLEYNLAWREISSIIDAIDEGVFPLLSIYGLCEEHRDRLLMLL